MTRALELRGITKRFGSVTALQAVDFTLEAGEIHALLGENGAGKSTLMGVASGLTRPDAGTIAIEGRAQRLGNAREARALGIGMVHQHFTSIPAFTVLENVALAAGWVPGARPNRTSLGDLMRRTGLILEPDAVTGELSAGLKQRLEVLKALAGAARILLLDEPTSVLAPPDAAGFLVLIRQLRSSGISTVLITHKLNEALAVADQITVLRRGAQVLSARSTATTRAELASAMLGAVPTEVRIPPPREPGPARVRVTNLCVSRQAGVGPGLRDATLEVKAGEVLGIAAVEGNGQRELLRTIARLLKPSSGTVATEGEVVFIPEDRTSEGLIPDFTLTENLVLRLGSKGAWVRRGWVKWDGARRRMSELIGLYGIRADGPDRTARALSGGNQQRVILGAALDRQPSILLAENPTRGLDFQATAEIQGRLRDLAAAGVAVLVHLPDLDELISVATRVVVLFQGVLSAAPPGADRAWIGAAMLGQAEP